MNRPAAVGFDNESELDSGRVGLLRRLTGCGVYQIIQTEVADVGKNSRCEIDWTSQSGEV